MRPKDKAIWAAALRSGKFKQGKGALCDRGLYCCLGVAFEVLVDEPWVTHGDSMRLWGIRDGADNQTAYLPDRIKDEIGLEAEDVAELVSMNDSGDASFDEIANHIEANL